MENSTVETSPKDVFMHLLAVILLYISASSFGALIFQYIDILFPDPLADFHSGSRDAVRWALAALVVVFPIFVWLSRTLEKNVREHKEKRELKTRKWLLCFTLFAASSLIIGDAVTLLYKFLSGDLSARFVMKALTIFFIAAVVFGYYLWNLRKETMASRDPRMRFLVFGIIALVAVSVTTGFFVAGTPLRERLRKFDGQRVHDLQNIQWQIVNYWQRKEKLPESLMELKDDISGWEAPRDPESGLAYEYRVRDKLKFELCAEFKTESSEKEAALRPVFPPGRGLPDNWSHSPGRICFERPIDPEIYGIKKEKRP